MKISFDFDGTLTEPKIRELCRSLMVSNDVYIITSRFASTGQDVLDLAKSLGISSERVFFMNGKEKSEFLKNNLLIDIHFDDDPFEAEQINKNTNILCLLVGFENLDAVLDGFYATRRIEEAISKQ